jgi:hypothetical protein
MNMLSLLQKLPTSNFTELCLDKKATTLTLIDDNGNKWGCIVVLGTLTQSHCMIGGQWKRMVDARRLERGAYLKIGAPLAGNNSTVYLSVQRL